MENDSKFILIEYFCDFPSCLHRTHESREDQQIDVQLSREHFASFAPESEQSGMIPQSRHVGVPLARDCNFELVYSNQRVRFDLSSGQSNIFTVSVPQMCILRPWWFKKKQCNSEKKPKTRTWLSVSFMGFKGFAKTILLRVIFLGQTKLSRITPAASEHKTVCTRLSDMKTESP